MTDTAAPSAPSAVRGPAGAAVPGDRAHHGAAGRFRPDIEGLRALAVGLVVASHLVDWPRGGFVGVDVFFVISGFLITGLLVRERERHGRISFADFYRRRARRILPVAALVIVVTVVASSVVFLGSRGRQTLVDGLWSAAFAANWHFAQIGTDYFQTALPPSPLQHYWSLAVEEQFYVVWPWVLLAAFAVGARTRIRSRTVWLVGPLLTVGGASLAWAMVETAVAPTSAYFSTFSRGWELAAGALLAVTPEAARRLPHRLRPVLAWAGLALIGASAVVIGPTHPFPGPWAVLPVAGTVLVILAGTGAARFGRTWPLTDPVSRYVGRISYSLYLWHWPVIVIFMAGVAPAASNRPEKIANAAAALVLALALSVLSFHLVEDPIRRSRWLEPRRAAPQRPAPSAPQRPAPQRPAPAVPVAGSGRLRLGVVAAGLAALAVVSVAVLRPWGQPASAAERPAAVAERAGEDADAVERALALTRWPATTPAIDDLADAGAPILHDLSCINGRADVDQSCLLGDPDAERTAVLLGDSIAMSWEPAVEQALLPRGWNLRVYGKVGCGFSDVTQEDKDGRPYTTCDAHHAWAFDRIAADPPDLVVVAESWGVRAVPAGGDGAETRWEDGMRASLDRLVATGADVVVLSAPPYGPSIAECATRLRSPQDCAFRVPSAVGTRGAAYVTAAQDAGARWVDTTDWFCAEGWCPPVIDDVVVRADQVHLTEVFARGLAERLAPRLVDG